MRHSTIPGEPELERALLRKAVDAVGRRGQRCHDCRRTPLTGERIYHYDNGRVVCELCRPLRREAHVDVDTVRGTESGLTVRVTARAAAL